jgi:hypothetical protein
MLGDGHTMSNGNKRYDTSSTRLANDFQRLCLHAGWACNIILKYKAGHTATITKSDIKCEEITSTVDTYRMTIIKTQTEPLVNKNIHNNTTEVDYVYDTKCNKILFIISVSYTKFYDYSNSDYHQYVV